MLKKTWRRLSSPTVWAVALVAGAPALVQAQTQMFPLAPITRERVPCPMEDPVYGLYRHQYFGYFPTCWRQFPPGWGCPSPEAPNAALEFQKQKRDPLPENPPGEPGLEPLPGENQRMPRNGSTPLPPLPPAERSPFDLDTAPNTPGGRIPEPGNPGAGAPRDDRAAPPATAPSASRVAPPQAAPGENEKGNEASAPLLGLPDPAEATPTPTPTASPAGAGLGAAPSGNGVAAGMMPAGPPALASASLPGMVNPVSGRPVRSPNLPANSPANVMAPSSVAPVVMPVQAPQRRGPLSTLFSGLTSKMRR